MIHLGKNTKSTIISKGISAGRSNNNYRGLVKMMPKAEGARNYTQCDSMLIGDKCHANTFPYIEVMNNTARVEHEATTSKISEEQLFYLQQRGHFAGRRSFVDHQRLLQRGLSRATDGIRRRGAETFGTKA